ncbi:MAG: hypothetical protein KF830_00395 [Planctomycetes bacterium]|nr:hypothetical protein [Planctomycetota bacterium]
MSARSTVLRWLATGLLAVAMPGQDPAATTLHDAWLREVLDLDPAAAAAGYRQVAADTRPGHLERWVAAARLCELARLQVVPAPASDLADAPPPLRAAFAAAAARLPATELLARVRGEPRTVLPALATEAGHLPPLRPVVAAAEDWIMRQVGPSLRDRWRQRMATANSRGRSADVARASERVYAADILRAELQGETAQADALRTLYFADWRPPVVAGDLATGLARVRRNLDAALRDEELPPPQAALLRDLAAAIDQRAAVDPAAAWALVQRLPLYAERLLQDEPAGRR